MRGELVGVLGKVLKKSLGSGIRKGRNSQKETAFCDKFMKQKKMQARGLIQISAKVPGAQNPRIRRNIATK
jgi:hypothetical protein